MESYLSWYSGYTRWRIGSETFKSTDRCKTLRTDSGFEWVIVGDGEDGLELRSYKEHSGHAASSNRAAYSKRPKHLAVSVKVVLGGLDYRNLVDRLRWKPKYSVEPWSWPGPSDPPVNCYGQPVQSTVQAPLASDLPPTIQEYREKLGDSQSRAAKTTTTKLTGSKLVERETTERTRDDSTRTQIPSKVQTGGKRTRGTVVDTPEEADNTMDSPVHKKRRPSTESTPTADQSGETAADTPKDLKQEQGVASTMTQLKRRKNQKSLRLTTKGVSVMNLHPDLQPRDIIRDHFSDLRGGTLLAMCDQLSDSGVQATVRQTVAWCNELHPSCNVSDALFRKVRSFALEAEDADEEGKPPRCKRCARMRIACSIRDSNGSTPCDACTKAGCAQDCALFDYKPQSRARQQKLGRG